MRKAEKIYIGAVLLEGVTLFLNSLFSLVWLWRFEIEQNMNTIRLMILATLIISFVLMPLESVVFHVFKKRRAPKEQTAQTGIVRVVLPKLISIFIALWLIHAAIFQIMAARYNWHHGSDIYMYYLRPGSRIIFLSALGLEISNLILNRKSE